VGWQVCVTIPSFYPLRWGIANFPGWLGTIIRLISAFPVIWDFRCMDTVPSYWLILAWTFCPSCSQIPILTSFSQVARIIGVVSHWHLTKIQYHFYRSFFFLISVLKAHLFFHIWKNELKMDSQLYK
jgi:hypothetical protein